MSASLSRNVCLGTSKAAVRKIAAYILHRKLVIWLRRKLETFKGEIRVRFKRSLFY